MTPRRPELPQGFLQDPPARPSRWTPGLLLAARIAAEVSDAGGRAWLAGGSVRDLYRGVVPDDVDLQVFGLSEGELAHLLARHGRVVRCGAAYPIFRLGPGRGWLDVGWTAGDGSPESLRGESLRRDLTVNALWLDPRTWRSVDLVGGRADLERRLLRPCGPRFSDDPGRVFRVMRLAATLEFDVTAEAEAACRAIDTAAVAPARAFMELERCLLQARVPSLGLGRVPALGLWPWFAELAAHESSEAAVAEGLRLALPRVDAVASWTQPSAVRLPELLAALLGRPTAGDGADRAEHRVRTFLDRFQRRGALQKEVVALVRAWPRAAEEFTSSDPPRLIAMRWGDRVPRVAGLLALVGAEAVGTGAVRDDAIGRVRERWDHAIKQAGVHRGPAPPLLTGHELRAMGIRSGADIGRWMEALRANQLAGRLGSGRDARAWLADAVAGSG